MPRWSLGIGSDREKVYVCGSCDDVWHCVDMPFHVGYVGLVS